FVSLRSCITKLYKTNIFTSFRFSVGALCIFYAVANVIIFILGVGGNGLVIWITGFKVKKSVVNTWYLSLALSDFLFCCTLPFSVIHVIMKDWIFGLFMCKLMFFAVYFNWFSSIFVLAIVSVDRCVLVKFPVWAQNKRTVRKASGITVLAWILSAVLSTPSFCFQDVLPDEQTAKVVLRDSRGTSSFKYLFAGFYELALQKPSSFCLYLHEPDCALNQPLELSQ
uniref:G-protein coupled receptors family 1 profile domain-containing protein n=1 Tax=Astyanax mexicanus TaxID=7994 RepID=A0A3B1JNC7_ASTMX